MIIQVSNIKRNTAALLLTAVAPFFLYSCGAKNKGEEGEQGTGLTINGDTILVKANSVVLPKLTYYTITEEEYQRKLVTAGIVKAIPNSYAEVSAPFAGRVIKSFVKLGQKVGPGTPLFSISSTDYAAAQKEYFDANLAYKQAERNLGRQRDLVEHGVGVKRDREEAETEYQTKKAAVTNASAALKIYTQGGSLGSLGQALIVTASIKGEIVDNKLVIGQYLKEDAAPLVVIAELSKVWIVGQVKEKDIRFIHELDGVEVNVAAFPEKKIIGKVYHVNEIVDETTRSVEVLIECPNSDHTLKPGMYATTQFIDEPSKTMFASAKSVLQFNDRSYVIVQIGKNQYLRKFVTTGVTDHGRVQITSGLTPGDKIVSEGAFYLLDAK